MPTPGFAVTDMQGSARLWERMGADFAPLLAHHNRILRQAAGETGGRVVRTDGDSFSVAFGDAAAAVAFALAVQTRLHAHPWPPGAGELRVRIGIGCGPAVPAREEHSAGLRLASLVCAAAHGGQVLFAGDLPPGLPGECTVLPLGSCALVPGEPPTPLTQLLPAPLAHRRFPPPRTTDAPATNLPAEAGPIVGRDALAEDLGRLLPSPAGRLVTLTGPAGVGKSRLARHVARNLLHAFPGGCWLADLSDARDPSGVAVAVARVLGATLGPEDPLPAIAEVLRFRRPLLLVLDGAETIVEDATGIFGSWLREARHARFLVTSRTVLGLSGERDVPVPPLAVPTSVHDAAGSPATELFVQRAAAVCPGFALTPATAEPVASICRALEGFPLSLELAAARLREMPLEKVAQELQRDTASLHDPGSAAAVAWSLSSLAPWELSALRQAAVFRGGFFLEAAEEVIDLSSIPDAPLTLDAVQALCDKSLLRTVDHPEGTRFSLFRQVRDSLVRDGEDPATIARHTAWVGRHGREWRDRVHTPRAREAIERLELERDNLLAAVDHADGAQAARLVEYFEDAFIVRGPLHAYASLLEQTRSRPDLPADARAQVAFALAVTRLSLGDPAAAASDLAALIPALPPSRRQEALATRGVALFMVGRTPEALADLDLAATEARALGDRRRLAEALIRKASIVDASGDTSTALPLAEEAEAIDRALGSPLLVGRDLGIRGMILGHAGRVPEALEVLESARRLAQELGHRAHVAALTGNMGGLLTTSDPARAQALHAESGALFRELGRTASAMLQSFNEGMLLFAAGEIQRPAEVIEESLKHALEKNVHRRITAFGEALGMVYSVQGNHERAIELLKDVEQRHLRAGDAGLAAQCRLRLSIAMHRAGREAEARALLPDPGAVAVVPGYGHELRIEALALRAVLEPAGSAAAAAAAEEVLGPTGLGDPSVASHPWTADLVAKVRARATTP